MRFTNVVVAGLAPLAAASPVTAASAQLPTNTTSADWCFTLNSTEISIPLNFTRTWTSISARTPDPTTTITFNYSISVNASGVEWPWIPTPTSTRTSTPIEQDGLKLLDAANRVVSALIKRRDECDPQNVCCRRYKFILDRWIIQVPESWWKNKYDNNAGAACTMWSAALKQAHDLNRVTECWEMDKEYPSGGKGWLHIRMNTLIGRNGGDIESVSKP